jgi:branched-subunit amino acid transport protein
MMDILVVVLVMTAVTYIPRLLPLLFMDAERIGPGIKKFLSFMPYAALGALVLPGGVAAVSGKPEVSIAALIITIIAAWFHKNIIVTVAVSVISVFLMLAISSGVYF